MDKLEYRVKQVIAKTLNKQITDIRLNHNLFQDLAVDSIDAVDCIVNLEQEFDMEGLFETASSIKTVSDLIIYIKSKLPAAQGR